MEIFWILLAKLVPLYLMIGLGYIASRFLAAQKETVGRILIYIITPAVVFYGTATANLDAGNLLLPLVFFAVACANCLLFLGAGKRAFNGRTEKNILAFAAGSANVGYFGLPVALALFDSQIFAMAVLSVMGLILYENTVGFFVVANGSYGSRASFAKLVRLPAIYAFAAGVLFNAAGFNLGGLAVSTLDYFKAAYTLLGMMLIGMGMVVVDFKKIDFKFVTLAFLAKFIIWPAAIAAVIFCDANFFHIFSVGAYKVMVLMSVVPLAANTVAYATEFKTCCDKAALAVLLSTLFALLYVPLAARLFLG